MVFYSESSEIKLGHVCPFVDGLGTFASTPVALVYKPPTFAHGAPHPHLALTPFPLHLTGRTRIILPVW